MISANVNHANWTIAMAGTGNQTLEVVDALNKVTISNNNTVTFTHPFTIRRALNLTGSTSTLIIQNDLTLTSTASTLTIPAGVTVELGSGANLYSDVNIIVNGVLRVKDGATLFMGNGKTITVNSGALLHLQGSAGNIAALSASGAGATYGLSVAGLLNASYFRIDRLNATGINLTGTLQSMSDGEFHYLASNGAALTVGAAATLPASLNNVGFFDDSGFGNVKNFKATAYNSTSISVNDWSGSAGGSANEVDPNGKINWGTMAGTELTVSNHTPSGQPPTSIAASSADTHFATFAFGLSQSAPTTDITQARVTMSGSATISDLSYVRVYKDTAGGTNCIYDVGVDSQVGSDLALSGNPLSAVVNFNAGDVQTSSDSAQGCFYIRAATSGTAQAGRTIQFGISATGDVVNSIGYSFSGTSGPPVTAGLSTVTGGTIRVWQGDSSTSWSANNNWTGNAAPTTVTDCVIGSATRIPLVNIASATCQNVTMQSGGTLNFNSSSNELAAYGSLDVQSGFIFQNSSSARLAMRGNSNQSLGLATTFPGHLTIANGGVSPSNVVTLSSNTTIQGNLTLTSGRLRVGTGLSLTVHGNITVQSGAVLDLEPGATLYMANNSVLTVALGGELELLGSSSANAIVSGISSTDAIRIVVNGTIIARYYSLSRLGNPGLSIEAGATIDATNFLQNGTFAFPVASSTTLVALKRQIPGNTLTNMSFASNGSTATSITNVDTSSAGAGTLTISAYSGDLAGPTYDVDPAYSINWTGASNTLNLDRPSGGEGPLTVNAGGTYNMGRFRFSQTQAGASYVDTQLLDLTVQINGTASGSDVSAGRLYYDSDCDGTSGVLISSGTFVGSPPTASFAIVSGTAPIEASLSSPPSRCIYLEADISSGATGGATIGFKISQASHVTNSASYQISGSNSFPVTLGTAATIQANTSTTWTGATNTNWYTSTNWTGGVPNSTKDCTINDVTNDPVIGAGTAICKNLVIGNGSVTMQNGVGATLQIYGNFQNTGTFTQNDGTLQIQDGGSGSNQSVSSSSVLNSLTFNKTTGGRVSVGSSSLQVTTVTVPGGSNFELYVGSGKTLILTNGITWPSGTFTLDNQSTLKLGAGSTLTISGGTFRTLGVNDFWPQDLSNKATITRSGASSTWGFSATGGSVSLTGFVIEWINDNGLSFSGTASLTALNGGQFRNLSTNYSAVKAIQLNISSIPAAAANIGWNWGPNNSPPALGDTYKLVSSTGCGNNTMSFDYWFGDWSVDETTPDPDSKISATNCTIVMGSSASPVRLESFTGAPYDASAVLRWHTTAEWNHLGFNLYRSIALGTFVKLNADLIRNGNTSPEIGEDYVWVDDGLTNGVSIRYMLEAVNITGGVDRYGPIGLTPQASNGPRPVPLPNSSSGAPGLTTGNPFLKDLGGGIKLTSITDSRIVLDITTPSPNLSPSENLPSYFKLEASGYEPYLDAGFPEMVHRSVLIEVESWVSSATLTAITNSSSITLHQRIQPSPQWTKIDSNNLTGTFSPDPVAYASAANWPVQNIKVDSQPMNIEGRRYVKVDFTPGLYHGQSHTTEWLTGLRVTIALTSDSSQPAPSIGNVNVVPSLVPNVIRAKVDRAGVFALRHQDLEEAGIESYLSGVPVTDLRAYIGQTQIPLKVESHGGLFSPGDQILAYVPPFDQDDDCCQEVVFTKHDLLGEGLALRIPVLDAQAHSAFDPSRNWTFAHSRAEVDSFMVWDAPVGAGHDHFFWKRIFDPIPSWVTNGTSRAVFQVDLPGLRNEVSGQVRINVRLISGAVFAQNITSGYGLWINSVPYRVAQAESNESGVHDVSFLVSANLLSPGTNSIEIEAIHGQLPVGDYQVTTLDKLEIDYRADLYAENGQIEILNREPGETTVATGFTSSDLILWDVSEPLSPIEYDNFQINSQDSQFSAIFAVPYVAPDGSGYRTWALERTAIHLPKEIFANRGYHQQIRNPSNRADLIIIANSQLMESARVYAQSRAQSGLEVALYSTDQVFAEFSGGRQSPESIREMLRYARSSWASPKPTSVLFIGKASVDPKNILGNSHGPTTVMPIAVDSGVYADYGSDHWFTAQEGNEDLPDIAVGRIPALSNEQVLRYLDKVEAYENGSAAPSVSGQTAHYVFSDGDTSNENFPDYGDTLKAELALLRPDLEQKHEKRTDANNDSQYAATINQSFANGPLLISLLGHGSTGFWAGANVLAKNQVQVMTNSRYPIVLGMGCMLGYHYDPDLTKTSLGETLILQPNGGAILFWGTPAVTIPSAQVALNQGFLREFSQIVDSDTQRVGTIITKAKLHVGVNPATRDTVRSWTLLGDPTLRLPASATKPAVINQDSEGTSTGGGCGHIGQAPPPPPSSRGMVLLILLMPLFLLQVLRFRVRRIN